MKSILITCLLIGSILALAEEAPSSFDWKNYAVVKSYVVGDESENNHLRVDWKANVLDGQRASSEQDKPLLLWLYFGGPLGTC